MVKRVILANIIIMLAFSFTFVLGTENEAKSYGKGITLKEETKVSEIMANPKSYIGKTVLVRGRVVNVCKKRGCWMELASDKEFESIKIKVEDGEIVFPLEARGKIALAEGTVEKIELTMEQTIAYLKHHAEEEGKAFDSTAVKETLVFYRIRGIGAEIID